MSLHAKLMNELRFDAGFSAFLDLDLQAIETELYRIVYTDLKARLWLPGKTDVPAGAESFAYKVLDGVGRADIVTHNSDELPMAGVRVEKKIGRIETVANAFAYSKQELRAAAMSGMGLDREEAFFAMRAHEEKFDQITLLGVPALGMVGFFNHPDTLVDTASDWDNPATTGATILADLRKLYAGMLQNSKGVYVPTQIILPLSSYLAAESRPVAVDYNIGTSALQMFKQTAGTAIEIGWDVKLETAGAGGSKRAVAYQKDPRVAAWVQPLAPEISEPQLINLVYKRTIESRVGQAAIKQPQLAMRYMDGM